MSLQLENVSRAVDGVDFIRDADLTFEPGSFNVLLGRTLAGKTSLMRLMAGLDKPDTGRILFNGEDVTGQSVRKRNVSMVYQQFINYPNLTVYENIASPLRLAKMKSGAVDQRVQDTAAMLRIEELLPRYPLELSGGQQQRIAMARALVKDATLVLFDEPLVNLDYKLREELRSELRQLFRERQCIAVYATTEASEALALGGTTTLLHEGRVVQTGPVAEVYRRPVNTLAAELFCEPPMNFLTGRIRNNEILLGETVRHPLTGPLGSLAEGNYLFGIRPSHIGLSPVTGADLALEADVELAEISGSETFLHVSSQGLDMVVQALGVHTRHVGDPVSVYLPLNRLFVFSENSALVHTPANGGGAHG